MIEFLPLADAIAETESSKGIHAAGLFGEDSPKPNDRIEFGAANIERGFLDRGEVFKKIED